MLKFDQDIFLTVYLNFFFKLQCKHIHSSYRDQKLLHTRNDLQCSDTGVEHHLFSVSNEF